MKSKRTAFLLCLTLLLATAACGQTKENRTFDFSGVTFTDYKIFDAPARSLRSMAVSPDEKSIYTGHILLTANGVRKINVADGKEQWIYHDGSKNNYVEYAKGIAADDRGYVYVTFTYESETKIGLTILKDSDGSVVSETMVDIGVLDCGANGITVYRDKDRYYAYFITNYGANRIYSYDVTNPETPVRNEAFGIDGIVNLPMKTGVAHADANYIAADAEGNLYITIKLAQGAKADAVAKLDNSGTTFEKLFDCEEAYGISISGNYLLVSTYQSQTSVTNIYQLSDYRLVASVGGDVAGHDHYSQAFLIGNRIYIADQRYQTGETTQEMGSRILVSGELPEKLK